MTFVHEGLGNASYLLDLGDGEAALVDPDRSIERYLRAAADRGLRVTAVLETHLHADFVTGGREAVARGATVFAAEDAGLRWPHRPVRPGDRFDLGDARVEVLETPGHTPEHVSFVVRAGEGPALLFSGGALIVGGAARTDLIDPSMTEELTRALFRTLHAGLGELTDDTVVLPTHEKKSFCSTDTKSKRSSTLGRERATNPVFAMENEDEFVRWFPGTFPGVPAYFSRMRPLNRRGPRLSGEILPPPPLDPDGFEDAVAGGALAVDVRSAEAFAGGHVPGSVSNPFRAAFGVWLGWLVSPGTPLAFVTDGEAPDAAVEEALLVGLEGFAGWLSGGIEAWTGAGKPVAELGFVDADAAGRLIAGGAAAVDVREPDEFARGHVEGAVHVPLGELEARAGELPRGVPLVAYCGHGERASSAASVLERLGFGPVYNLDGGFGAWREAALA